MKRLTRAGIRRALEALAAALPVDGATRELWIVGGAALVLLFEASGLVVRSVATEQLLATKLWEADRGPA